MNKGNTTNAVTNAKRVSDYVEQTRQTNYSTLKDVFLTKDDKADIMNKFSELPQTLKEVFLTKDDKIDIIKEITSAKTTLMWAVIILMLPIYVPIIITVIHNWKP